MKRSITLKIAAGVRDSESWRRLFLSVQMLEIVACETSLLRVLLVTESFNAVHSAKAIQVWNARWEYPSLRRTKTQISSLISHCRNKCVLVSSTLLQRQQEDDIFIPQLINLVLVGRRSWWAIHAVKAWRGTWPLNQIFRVQSFSSSLFRTTFHVLRVEKVFSSVPSISQA